MRKGSISKAGVEIIKEKGRLVSDTVEKGINEG